MKNLTKIAVFLMTLFLMACGPSPLTVPVVVPKTVSTIEITLCKGGPINADLFGCALSNTTADVTITSPTGEVIFAGAVDSSQIIEGGAHTTPLTVIGHREGCSIHVAMARYTTDKATFAIAVDCP